MIKVDDLIEWAGQNAIGRSTSYPNGWIDATTLKKLAEQVERSEPLPYVFSETVLTERGEANEMLSELY